MSKNNKNKNNQVFHYSNENLARNNNPTVNKNLYDNEFAEEFEFEDRQLTLQKMQTDAFKNVNTSKKSKTTTNKNKTAK